MASGDDRGIGNDTQQGGEGGGPIEGQGGEGLAKEEATAPIGDDDQIKEQTQHKAPADDVGGQRGGEDRPGA